MMAPKGFVYILTWEPVRETLFRKRIFADVTVRNLKTRPRWTSHMSPIGHRQGDTEEEAV